MPLGQPTSASSLAWEHGPASPGLKAHGRSRGGATMVCWWWRSANSGNGRWRGGGKMVLGESRRGGEAIWGGEEDGKLSRRSLHGGVTQVGKHDSDGMVRGQGWPVLGLGSTRAILGSSRRC
jgi:hypothetical protein